MIVANSLDEVAETAASVGGGVVLIFDVWHPHLTPAERALITALATGMDKFVGSPGDFGL